MVMEKITVSKAKEIASGKGLKPGKVLGTNGVQFTMGDNARIKVIDWGQFEELLTAKKLAVYESAGWMKIMKA